jgi:hypothetical protein
MSRPRGRRIGLEYPAALTIAANFAVCSPVLVR